MPTGIDIPNFNQDGPGAVLLLGLDSVRQVSEAQRAVDRVRAAFPGLRVVALEDGSRKSLPVLRQIPNIDDILDPSSAGETPEAFSGQSLKGLVQSGHFSACVIYCGRGADQNRSVLVSLLSPGRWMLLDGRGRLFPPKSGRGLGAGVGAAVRYVHARYVGWRLRYVNERLTRWALLPPKLLALKWRTRHAPKQTFLQRAASRNVRRILWIQLDAIGDTVISLPALRALKAQFPEARIDALILPPSVPLLADQHEVDEIITYGHRKLSRTETAGLRDDLALIRRLRHNRYDLAIDMRGEETSRLIAYWSGAPLRVSIAYSLFDGVPPHGASWSGLMTHPVFLENPRKNRRHMVDYHLDILEGLGIPVPGGLFYLRVTPEQQERVRGKLHEQGISGPYATIHPRGFDRDRDWRPERFAAVADHLARRYGWTVLLTGGPGDRDYNERVLQHVEETERVRSVAGLFSISELPALYSESRLMVALDTGPMHIASAVGTPTVALFLPWQVPLFYPYGQMDSVVVPRGREDLTKEEAALQKLTKLLDGIPVEDVIEAVDRKLALSESLDADTLRPSLREGDAMRIA